MKVLVTGGAGFIGTHTIIELVAAGMSIVVVDNLRNASKRALDRVRQITGGDFPFYEGDIGDRAFMDSVFQREKIDSVIHFAAYKAVGESEQIPLEYYRNNVGSTVTLLQAMEAAGVFKIVFSSSATVYGEPERSPIPESAPRNALNTYGRTKLMVEDILTDAARADPRWKAILLRYFNPVGAHPSGLIGEDPKGIPNNLFPYILQVAVGRRDTLTVFGNDYPTPDGTGQRDYIHVVDLADAHVKACTYMENSPAGAKAINIGTGNSDSVLDVIHAFEKATGVTISYQFGPRRAGDVPAYWADPSLARTLLGWQSRYDLEDMSRDAWKWQSENPNGFELA